MEGPVVVWEVATGQAAFRLRPVSGSMGDLAWSPDGQRLATVSIGGTVTVWEMASGKEAMRRNGHGLLVHAVTFLPDGKRLLACENEFTISRGVVPPRNELRIWDTTSGEGRVVLRSQEKEDGLYSVCIAPDRSRVAVGFGEGTVKVWSAKDLLGK
jgi:WD40 repeat protein